MSTIPSGVVKFSDLQTSLGGSHPIKMSEYFLDATEGYSTGVDGIPNKFSAIRMSVFRGKTKNTGPLYTFVSHTFTNAGATGRNGPTLSQCKTAYSSTTWASNTSYFNVSTQGIQVWTVPATGNYNITVAGAASGWNYNGTGNGVTTIVRSVSLTKGSKLYIVVGQRGIGSGGGGASWIFLGNLNSASTLIVAGGGGGSGYNAYTGPANSLPTGQNGSTTRNGGNGASTSNSGGTGGTEGSAGGGANGQNGNGSAGSGGSGGDTASNSQTNVGGGGGGGVLGINSNSTFVGGTGGADGGFGGGGSGAASGWGGGGGGGGGYSGGGGGAGGANNNEGGGRGGGGGSFVSNGIIVSSVALNADQGYVTIELPLYEFTSHTFTNASATGREGPTLLQCRNAYSSVPWTQDTTNNYLNMVTPGIQLWKVPATGNYRFLCAGAGGGDANEFGGRGIIIQSTLWLSQGDIIKILVGQKGGKSSSSGGGGGTFVATNADTALVVAGGGAGFLATLSSSISLSDASSTTSGKDAYDGTGTGGTNAGGGTGSSFGWGGGGGGFTGNGTAGSKAAEYSYSGLGKSFVNGGVGGDSASSAVGGFGGGGGTHGNTGGGGGGGGYSGGGGSGQNTLPNTGGGGGSASMTPFTTNGYNTDHGYVTIDIP